jgi:hypothetical protein
MKRKMKGEGRMKSLWMFLSAAALLAGCAGAASTPSPTPSPTLPFPTVVAPTGYRPLQAGDVVEGVSIDYQYFVPSLDQPVVVVAVGSGMLQLITPRSDAYPAIVAYAQEIQNLLSKGAAIYAFDENDPKQTDPRALNFDGSKPIEIAYVPLQGKGQKWSVTEGEGQDVFAGYKFIRRKDGGLRFVDAYDARVLSSTMFYTLNIGSGGGLILSARLALLRTILANPQLQRGANVFGNWQPPPSAYDARILKIDPTKEGLQQNVDWVIMTRPGPNPGLLPP